MRETMDRAVRRAAVLQPKRGPGQSTSIRMPALSKYVQRIYSKNGTTNWEAALRAAMAHSRQKRWEIEHLQGRDRIAMD